MHRDPLTQARHTVACLGRDLEDLVAFGGRGVEAVSRVARTRDALVRAELELRALRLSELGKRMTRMRTPRPAPRRKPVQLELELFDEPVDDVPYADEADVVELPNVIELPLPPRRTSSGFFLLAGGVL